MDWQTYEGVVRQVYESLGRGRGVEIVCCGRACTVKGASGVDHQIDVLTRHTDGVHSFRTAIECKYWKDKVSKDTVMKVESVIRDARIEKGVIVSKIGFTSDATSYAKSTNISLVELRAPTDADWKGRIKNIDVTVTAEFPEISSLKFVRPPEFEDEVDREVRIDKLVVEHENGSILVADILNAMIQSGVWETHEGEPINYDLPSNSVIRVMGDESRYSAVALEVTFSKVSHSDSFQIRGENHVAFLMKAIFEDRLYIITSDGSIHERDP